MSLHTWWLFLLTVFLLSGTPGPNMLHVMGRSVDVGVRRSLPVMLGCLLAVVGMLVASAMGLSALLMAFPAVFEGLRYFGAAYLAWLGIKAWRDAGAGVATGTVASAGETLSGMRLFRGGLLVGLSNPKLLLFAAAFLPQFVDGSLPRLPQFTILVVTFAACELFWYAVYAGCGRQLRRGLQRPGLRRWFDRATGVVFVGFGVLLLRFRPA